MAKKVDDHRGMPLQTAKAAAREAFQFIDRGRDSVLHVTLDPGIALFLGIEVWRIGRQESDGELVLISGEEAFRRPHAMGVEPVPNDQQPWSEATTKVAQGVDHDGAGDRAANVSGSQPAIGCDADDARNFPSLADTLQPRRASPERPCQPCPGAKGMPGLIDQDDGKAMLTRLFLSATHSRVG
jgi:hypothetical protein